MVCLIKSHHCNCNHLENCRISRFTDCPLFACSEKLIVLKLYIKTTWHFPLKSQRVQNSKPAEICMIIHVLTCLQNNNLPQPPWSLLKSLKFRKPSNIIQWEKRFDNASQRDDFCLFLKDQPKFCQILKLKNCTRKSQWIIGVPKTDSSIHNFPRCISLHLAKLKSIFLDLILYPSDLDFPGLVLYLIPQILRISKLHHQGYIA